MTDEMKEHIDRETARRIAEGEEPQSARRHAAIEFGHVDSIKEGIRDGRFGAWFEQTWRDLRYAVRVLAHSPGFAMVAIVTLAIGIGVNTAMFSVVNTLLFDPAPYPNADRLVRIYRTTSQTQTAPHSLPDLGDVQEQTGAFDSVAAYCLWTYSFVEPGQPAETLSGVTASADLFRTLGVQPALGRAFTAEEQQPGRDRVAVLSHNFWQSHFNGDPGVLGRAVRIDGESVDIIGIMPASSAYPLFWGDIDVWRPLSFKDDWRQYRAVQWLGAIGRLRPGVSAAAAQVELDAIAARIAGEFPETNAGAGLRTVPFAGSAINDVGRKLTWLTLGLAGFVLLIACANLGNLQLARHSARAREVAIRTALGATRMRLVRQLLAQSLVLAAGGGALGLYIAYLITTTVAPRMLGPAAAGTPFDLDPRVLGFAVFATVLTGVLSGSMPAWFASRADVSEGIKQQARGSSGGRSQQRVRQALIVAQVAFSLVLLAGSGFFMRGLQRVVQQDPGWSANGVLQGTITLPDNLYADDASRRAFHYRLIMDLQRLPAVEKIALSTALPLVDFHNPAPISIDDRPSPPPGQEPLAYHYRVSPDYFEVMGIRLLEGRLFDESLREDGPRYVVINETMARHFWPNESALGKPMHDPDWPTNKGEIIGVVRDVEIAGEFGSQSTRLQVYYPISQNPWGYFTIVLRSPVPESLIGPVRQAVSRLDADLPVANLQPTAGFVAASRRNLDVANQLLAGFAATGLGLAAIGLYGVISGLVAQRRLEFGIRLALGAQPRDVLWQVLRAGSVLALVGTVIGLVGAAGVLQLLGTLIPGLSGSDPLGLAGIVLLLLGVALVACWLPARRAARTNPLTALRSE